MDAIDDVPVLQLGVNEADAALVLSTEANWNQTVEDWRFFLTNGVVFGIRNVSQLIATAALLPYSDSNAWVSMVLVAANWRRRGLATRLLDACLGKAREFGLTCWLDATPAGALVYGPLGFMPTVQLQRLRLSQGDRGQGQRLSISTIDALAARDRDVMGFDRDALLAEFGRRPRSRMMSSGESIALVRDGRTARHIGPIYAKDTHHALRLVDAVVHSEAGPLLVDAVASHETFIDGLTDMGWRIERPFQRMRLGRPAAAGNEIPFAVAGPEFG
jgi:GNAT superfamily N-acetyltransferase